MAIYHLSTKPVSRGRGRSATAAAAYRASERIYDARTGETHDYSRKRGVEHAEIVLPANRVANSLDWARDRSRLWNVAEAAERRKDARVAREYEVALPSELTREQRTELVRRFSQEISDRFGAAVDFTIHKPHREGDQRNHHAHVLTTTREVIERGLGSKTLIEQSDTVRRAKGLDAGADEVSRIRARWAELTNDALKTHGHAARVDHRRLEAQGITDREPTMHKGPAVSAMERRGERSFVSERMREEVNDRLQRAAELGRLERAHERPASIIDLSADLDAARRNAPLTEHLSPQETRARAREAWLAYRQGQGAESDPVDNKKSAERTREKDAGRSRNVPDHDTSL